MTTTSADLDTLRQHLDALQQSHVLNFYDQLSDREQHALLAQIGALPLENLPALIDQYVHNKPTLDFDPTHLEPAPYYPNDHTSPIRPWDREHFKNAGEALIRAGKVAAFTVAGGQGSRLGFDGPKGKYPAGPVTGKPLFHVLADRILATESHYGATIPWYVMTSPINHDETVAFFKDNNHFGHRADDIMFFPQGVMPSFDINTGKLLLTDKATIATNPDGHGGSLRALHTSGATQDMRQRGIEQISYFQIDNPIVRAIDPLFIGLHAAAPDSSAQMCAKVVLKTEPGEKVGVICRTPRGIEVVEYSDLPTNLAKQHDDSGLLTFRLGSIAVHIISVDFVTQLNQGADGFSLPFHRAEKKVPCIDPDTGDPINPESPNGIKLETFVFDALPLADQPIVFETDRIDEFAPIKNADGADSPATCAAIQTERAARFLEAHDISVPRNPDGTPNCTLELSPMSEICSDFSSPKPIEPSSTLLL